MQVLLQRWFNGHGPCEIFWPHCGSTASWPTWKTRQSQLRLRNLWEGPFIGEGRTHRDRLGRRRHGRTRTAEVFSPRKTERGKRWFRSWKSISLCLRDLLFAGDTRLIGLGINMDPQKEEHVNERLPGHPFRGVF